MVGPLGGRGAERGMTLLISLGFLAVLMMFAMSFAITARTERKAAGADADLIRARLLAESGVSRAVAMLESQFKGEVYPGSNFYRPASGSPWYGRGYLASINGADTAGIEAALGWQISNLALNPSAVLHSSVGWLPMKSTRSINGADQQVLMGRYSYLIVDESGTIDPGAVVSTIDPESSPALPRTGASTAEISLAGLGLANADAFRPDKVITGTPGQMPINGRWFSMSHIVKGTQPADQAQMDTMAKTLFPFSNAAEQFWRDTNNDGAWNTGEDEDRVDLHDVVNSDTLATLYNLFLGADKAAGTDDCTWLKQLDNNTWVESWKTTAGVTADKARQRIAAQIAANIIDYADENSAPTEAYVDSDGDIHDGLSYTPGDYSVSGVERTWGLTEVAMRVQITSASDSGAPVSAGIEPQIVDPVVPADTLGIPGGHIDVDTCSYIAGVNSGSTDGHIHEYDNKHNVADVDYFNLIDSSLHNIARDVPNAGTTQNKFKLIVANADLSPGAKLQINGVQTPVTTYDNTSIASLPVYSLTGASGTTKLTSLKMCFDTTAILTKAVIPTNTGDVRKNVPGKLGEWRNGALTVQAVKVNDNGTDAFTTNVSKSNGGVQGVATEGLLWESTTFWHWKGPSYHQAGWDTFVEPAGETTAKNARTKKVTCDTVKKVIQSVEKCEKEEKYKEKDKDHDKDKDKDKDGDKDGGGGGGGGGGGEAADSGNSPIYVLPGFKAEAFYPFAESQNAGGASITYTVVVQTNNGAIGTAQGTLDIALDRTSNTGGGTLGYTSNYADAPIAVAITFTPPAGAGCNIAGDLNINPSNSRDADKDKDGDDKDKDGDDKDKDGDDKDKDGDDKDKDGDDKDKDGDDKDKDGDDKDKDGGDGDDGNVFQMETPSGLIDANTLHTAGSSYTYTGSASSIKIKPKSAGLGGTDLTIGGSVVNLKSNTWYTITAASMTVTLHNLNSGEHDKDKAMGQFWLDINASGATISPDPTGGSGGIGDDSNWTSYTIVQAQIDEVTLWDSSGQAVDVTPIAGSSDYLCNWAQSGSATSAGNYYASLTANDCLNNERGAQDPMFATYWNATNLSAADGSGIGTLTGSGYQTAEYANIDVANADFERLGELGRLHSYQPMRSLRLWSANSGDVAGNDAAILDLFKIAPAVLRRGRVNINSLEKPVLQALFNGVTAVSASSAADAVLTRRTAGTTFTNIGEVFGATPGIFGTDPKNDSAAEAAIAKLAELVTVRQNYFTVLVCAQAMTDVAGIRYDSNGDGTIDATAAYGQIDVKRDPSGQVVRYVDRILADQRMLVVVSRDAFSGKCQIVNSEFLQE